MQRQVPALSVTLEVPHSDQFINRARWVRLSGGFAAVYGIFRPPSTRTSRPRGALDGQRLLVVEGSRWRDAASLTPRCSTTVFRCISLAWLDRHPCKKKSRQNQHHILRLVAVVVFQLWSTSYAPAVSPSPAPVVEHISPAQAVFQAPAPLVEYIAPAPMVI